MPPPESAVEPPKWLDFSMTSVLRPEARAANAAVMPPPPEPMTRTSTTVANVSLMPPHRRPDRQAGDELGSRLVVAPAGLIRCGGGQRCESGYPGADFVRGVAAVTGDEG